ncbi:lysylphosphatidylglycerol synthase transmembrane domain-containing protein [Sediminicola luteus]|uniref:TIGR00374 family protein n=1 Tax=Sediminicola luteus TaxID=319238 RepID=A0A2A4G4B6_9FLAO|nr:lysylphosphatidylglycerol synthase transmembrane domain-containing protein [Sediminicola luteus]PCE62818.1 hypothetical protein B7P33_16180 [Sediminicola luteus]
MSKSLKKILKTVLPIGFGLGLIAYSYAVTTPEEREQIVTYITNADLFWVGISVLLGFLSHLSRAIRWNFLLEPLGYRPSLLNRTLLVFVAYFANLGIPRAGEILRATGLDTYEKVPFEKGFGTIVTERIIDPIMLLSVIGLALILQTESIMDILMQKKIDPWKIGLLALAGLAGLLFFVLVIKRSNHALALKIKNFITGLLEGVLSVFKMKQKGWFLFHTFFIWACYVGMFWVIKFTVPETVSLGFGPILVAFVAGAFAMTASNGGLGIFPVAVSAILVAFGISKVSGDAFGWIMWISQTLMVVLFGAISFFLLPLYNKDTKG